MVKGSPYNAEAALAALEELITPIDDFYVRSNFPTPEFVPADYRLVITGLVERPLSLSLAELAELPTVTITATMECAGNNRTRMAPIPEGEPWEIGAISTATWTGYRLADLLHRAGIAPGAVEVRFEGADRGVPRGRSETVNFERSLPIDVALDGEVLLVTHMNGAPLTAEHGHPLRVLVPGWYGMSGVKWLRQIEVLAEPFIGHYQTRQYRYYWADLPDEQAPPVRTMRIKSLITSPESGTAVPTGAMTIDGVAWCGEAAVIRVELSVDAGPWQEAELRGTALPHTWRRWRWHWPGAPVGRHSIRVRATAADGTGQPDAPPWNRLGYGNNAVQVTLVNVRPATG
jgi:DMSO/TMAO reductase YedYZ molybdopterin-dependent catalytic subunit